MPHPNTACTGLLAVALVASFTVGAAGAAPAERTPLTFAVTYPPEVHRGPISARVYVMLGPADGGEPRRGPNWFQPKPFFAINARDWKPGEPLSIGADAAGFPGPLAALRPGRYAVQAVIRLNPDTHQLGDGEGNAYGLVERIELDPAKSGTVVLVVDHLVPPRPFPESDRVKLVELASPLLSAFHGRPIRHRAAVILPEGDRRARCPRFTSSPASAAITGWRWRWSTAARYAFGKDFIRVVLDPDCGMGHHVFADSATNGPRGGAGRGADPAHRDDVPRDSQGVGPAPQRPFVRGLEQPLAPGDLSRDLRRHLVHQPRPGRFPRFPADRPLRAGREHVPRP